MKEVKIGTMAPVCFTAASEFSNFPGPARTGKTAHNSHRFLRETLLRQCSLEPQGLIFPDRRTSEIRKLYPRYIQSGTMVPIFTSSQGFRPKLALASVIISLKFSHLKLLFTVKNALNLSIVKNVTKYVFSQQTRRVEKSRTTVRSRHIASLALSYFADSAVRENEPLRLKRTLSEQRFHQETGRVVSGFPGSSRAREIRKCRRSGKADVGPWFCSFPHSQPLNTSPPKT